MKNKVLATVAVTIICFTAFMSCKKEIVSNNQNDNYSIMSSTLNMPTIVTFSTNHGNISMLHFDTWQDFENLTQYLKNQISDLEDSFINANPNLNDEQLNALEDSIGFNNELPLINFENNIGFNNTYRLVYNTEMNNWLSQDSLDLNEDPSMNTLFTLAELSLLNNKQEVMVGDSVYHFDSDAYAIIGGTYATALDEIYSNPKDRRFGPSTVAWWILGDEPGCKLWIKRSDEPYEYSDKLVTKKAAIRSITVYCKILAEMKSYKRKSSGGWKLYRTDMALYVSAPYLRDINCDPSGPALSKYEMTKKRKIYEAERTTWGTNAYGSYRAQNGTTVSGVYGYYGFTSGYTLNW